MGFSIGGEGGIRTHGALARTPDFESGTFDHSATSPFGRLCRKLGAAKWAEHTDPRPQEQAIDRAVLRIARFLKSNLLNSILSRFHLLRTWRTRVLQAVDGHGILSVREAPLAKEPSTILRLHPICRHAIFALRVGRLNALTARPSTMIEFGHGTHTGLRREHNEDTYCADPDMGLWLVADGMGGHEHGEVASALARDVVIREVNRGKSLADAIQAADEEIIRHSNEKRSERPMGTTVVAVRVRNHDYEVAWVGDSRVYLWNAQLRQISQDHSYVQELIDQGAISAAQARTHPHRNVVTQALGVTMPDQLKIETLRGTLQPGQALLLCSDGLTEEVEDLSISEILGRGLSTQETVDHLILAALDHGGSDNITVLLVKCI